jgi:hypothetical protein
MRILIVSLPRTGSTSLLKKISTEKNLTPIFEPFAPNNNKIENFKTKYEGEDNVVIKTLITEAPTNNQNKVEWFVNFSLDFDEVILLTRRDLIECAKSWSYLIHQRENGKHNFNAYSEYYWEPTPNYETVKTQIIKWDEELREISKKLNVSLTFYEDIFDLNSENRLRKGDKKNEIKLI